MKKIALVIAATLALALSASAQSQILFGSLTTVDNTTSNSAAITIGTQSAPGGSISIQHGVLTSTNDFYIQEQISLDGTNFVTIATFHPSSTNAISERWQLSYTMPRIYLRGSCTSTNSVAVGGIYQN